MQNPVLRIYIVLLILLYYHKYAAVLHKIVSVAGRVACLFTLFICLFINACDTKICLLTAGKLTMLQSQIFSEAAALCGTLHKATQGHSVKCWLFKENIVLNC